MNRFMNFRNLSMLGSVVALVFAVGLLLAPKTLLTYYGLRSGNTENLVAQLLGASLFVPGLVSWFAKDMSDMNARRSVATSIFLFDVIGFGVTLFVGMFPKVMPSTGWSLVLIFLLFALGYGYFLFVKPSEL